MNKLLNKFKKIILLMNSKNKNSFLKINKKINKNSEYILKAL